MMVGSEQRADLDSTQLTWRLTKLIRATAARDAPGVDDDDEYYRCVLATIAFLIDRTGPITLADMTYGMMLLCHIFKLSQVRA